MLNGKRSSIFPKFQPVWTHDGPVQLFLTKNTNNTLFFCNSNTLCFFNSKTLCFFNSNTLCFFNSNTLCFLTSKTLCFCNSNTLCFCNSHTSCFCNSNILRFFSIWPYIAENIQNMFWLGANAPSGGFCPPK